MFRYFDITDVLAFTKLVILLKQSTGLISPIPAVQAAGEGAEGPVDRSVDDYGRWGSKTPLLLSPLHPCAHQRIPLLNQTFWEASVNNGITTATILGRERKKGRAVCTRPRTRVRCFYHRSNTYLKAT